MPEGIDWRDMLKIALGLFGMTPDVFWSMTLHEWNALCEERQEASAGMTGGIMSREELEDLKQRFPDK